jgi:hypothetical protein
MYYAKVSRASGYNILRNTGKESQLGRERHPNMRIGALKTKPSLVFEKLLKVMPEKDKNVVAQSGCQHEVKVPNNVYSLAFTE